MAEGPFVHPRARGSVPGEDPLGSPQLAVDRGCLHPPHAPRLLAGGARMSRLALAAGTLWYREIVRFYRDRGRVIGALAPPVLFWFIIGSGLQGSFSAPGAAPGAYLQFFFPGTLLLIVLFTAIFSTISIIEDRHQGFLQAVLVAPIPRSSLVLGKLLGGTTLGFLQGLTFLLLTPWTGLHLSPTGLGLVLLELWLISFGLTGLGFWIAWKMDSTQGFHAVMNLFLMPMWILSGSLFPASGAPVWLRWVMNVNPVTYAAAALQHGFGLNPGGLPSFTTSIAVTLAFDLVAFLACAIET